MSEPAAPSAGDLATHERLLWGLAYRMTGSAADADDVVQDAFVRALERPPARGGDLRPWLVKVALNLARDRLRRRKRREYKGPWLPAPIGTSHGIGEEQGDLSEEPASFEVSDAESPARRYELVESVSMAFLLALEALSPKQRAVVLLCDVFEHSVQEAAELLDVSAANVKVLHHRARRALEAYDKSRVAARRDLTAKTRGVLQAFAFAIASGDEATARALCADGAVSLNDGGGEFVAARVPIVGALRCVKAMMGIARKGPPLVQAEMRLLAGLPTMVIHQAPAKANVAPLVLLQVELDARGLIRRIYTLLARAKVSAALRASS